MLIKSFSPCADWFFVYNDAEGTELSIRLAGWALTEGKDGADVVVGMVAAGTGSQLVAVPQVTGVYKHEGDMPRPIGL